MSLVAQDARRVAERSEPILCKAATVLEQHEALMLSSKEMMRSLGEVAQALRAACHRRTKIRWIADP